MNPRIAAVSLLGLAGCLAFQKSPQSLAPPERYVSLGQERVYVEEHGVRTTAGAPSVLLVHGFGATGRSWNPVLPRLVARHHVLVVDLPGFGRSDKYAGDYSIAAVASKLHRVLDLRQVGAVQVVCHSWGTAVCLAMALQRPDRVRSLTLISSFAYDEQRAPFLVWAQAPGVGEVLFALFWDSRLDDRLNYSFHDPQRVIHPDAVENVRGLMRLPGAMAASLAVARGMSFGWMEPRYSELRQPVLVISGREDAVTRLPAATRLVNQIPGARHVVIPSCGHVPMVEQPAKLMQALLAFLDPQPGPR